MPVTPPPTQEPTAEPTYEPTISPSIELRAQYLQSSRDRYHVMKTKSTLDRRNLLIPVFKINFWVYFILPSGQCDYTMERVEKCIFNMTESFIKALGDGSFFTTLQNVSLNLGDSVFPNAQYNTDLYSYGVILKQQFPTSLPTGQPTSQPSPKYTSPPTGTPKPLIIKIPNWLLAAIILGLIIALVFAYISCCTKNINKLKIVAMVNEILDDDAFEESKEAKYR